MRFYTSLILFAATLPAFAQQPPAAAPTTLHIPFFVEIEGGVQPNPVYTYVPVSEINPALIAKGLPAQQESVDLTSTSHFDSLSLSDQLTSALGKAGIEHAQAAGEAVPATYKKGQIQTCYTGDGNGVVDIVLKNTDNIYSDQYSLLAWKLGEKTVYSDSVDSTDKEFLSGLYAQSNAWKFYRKTSDSVVILASVGDDGTDVQTSVIPRCK